MSQKSPFIAPRWQYLILIVGLNTCVIFLFYLLRAPRDAAATPATGCTIPYQPGNGWVIELCPTDPNIPTPAAVILDGVPQGAAASLRIYHQSQNNPSAPQVFILYASGYLRLKPNADPSPPIPFGGSFILGPAYWSHDGIYHHNPQLTHIALDTAQLPRGPLHLQISGTNDDFDVFYHLTLPAPQDQQTRLHVTQVYTATSNITIEPTRFAQAEGFKLVQVSTMYINEGGTCAGGFTDCHDSNAARFIAQDLTRHQVIFTDTIAPAYLFNPVLPLSSTWLDVLHTDNESWQGNTPNLRVALDVLPTDHTITPQGWLAATNNPNDDNVGLWLHHDDPATQTWMAGETDHIAYWLLAQDDPPEPWSEAGLRSGLTFLDFESSYDCYFVHDMNQSTSGTVQPIPGYTNIALQLAYDLGSSPGNWAQIRCDFDPPLDLSAYDHLRFDWLGDPNAANSLEISLVNPAGSQEHIFGRGYGHVTHRSWWGQMVIPFSFLHPWTPSTLFDPGAVSAIFFSTVISDPEDMGGTGHFAIDNLNAYNVQNRPVPDDFATGFSQPLAAQAAAAWLAQQQQPGGLLKSWAEEPSCYAYVYDQALALLVFAHAHMWNEADALVQALAAIQNSDGSWLQRHDCTTNTPTPDAPKWEGDIAWAIYALSQYLTLGGTHPQAEATRDDAAAWLTTRLDNNTGCLVLDHTEATLDAWWALQAAGGEYIAAANGLRDCLLHTYWDDTMGRFKGGANWYQPYLDNQTWGAAFLKAIGEENKAHRALSYAYQVFRLPAQGAQLIGLDGQAGPWSVWNEGMGQYVAVGGPESAELLAELLVQQHPNGAMPGSPDDFAGGGVWTSRWQGVSAAAWFYFALNQEPFHPSSYQLLPLLTTE